MKTNGVLLSTATCDDDKVTTSDVHSSPSAAVTASESSPTPRLFRSNSLIKIEINNTDDESSNSSASNDFDCYHTPTNGIRHLRSDLSNLYPHSDTECCNEPSSEGSVSSRKKLTVLLPFNHQVSHSDS